MRERDTKEAELVELLKVKPSDLWERDLGQLLEEFEVRN